MVKTSFTRLSHDVWSDEVSSPKRLGRCAVESGMRRFAVAVRLLVLVFEG
jgi:hypothetical protein